MKRNRLVVWLAVGHLANDWPMSSLWLIVPAIGIATHLSPAEIGLLFAVVNVGAAMAYVPAGFLSDRVTNRGRLLAVTFWWVACGFLLACLALNFWTLALLLAFAGMGNAAWHPAASAVLAHEAKGGRAYALGMHAVGGSMAEMLAPLAAGVLLAYLDWRIALAVSAIPTLAMGVFFLAGAQAIGDAQPTKSNPDIGRLSDFLAIWRQGDGIKIALLISIYNMALMGMLAMIPLYLVSVHQFSSIDAGFAFSALLVAGTIAQPPVGRASDRLGRKPIIIAGTMASGLGCLLVATAPNLGVVLSGMVLAVAALDAIRPAALAAAVDLGERRAGATVGLAYTLMEGVGALGALAAGVVADRSWSAMFSLAAALCLAAGVLAWSIAKKGGAHPDAS